jgi:hypothetical protein
MMKQRLGELSFIIENTLIKSEEFRLPSKRKLQQAEGDMEIISHKLSLNSSCQGSFRTELSD